MYLLDTLAEQVPAIQVQIWLRDFKAGQQV